MLRISKYKSQKNDKNNPLYVAFCVWKKHGWRLWQRVAHKATCIASVGSMLRMHSWLVFMAVMVFSSFLSPLCAYTELK